jgi:hypothetical protein
MPSNKADTFLNFVEKDQNGCWLWQRSKTKDGYGNFSINGMKVLVHRWSFEFFKGRIPAGLVVCHACDVPACLNPDHLFLGSQAENMQDMVNKNRHGPNSREGESNGRAKLKTYEVHRIRRDYSPGKTSQTELAARYNVSQAQIQRILCRTRWRHV